MHVERLHDATGPLDLSSLARRARRRVATVSQEGERNHVRLDAVAARRDVRCVRLARAAVRRRRRRDCRTAPPICGWSRRSRARTRLRIDAALKSASTSTRPSPTARRRCTGPSTGRMPDIDRSADSRRRQRRRAQRSGRDAAGAGVQQRQRRDRRATAGRRRRRQRRARERRDRRSCWRRAPATLGAVQALLARGADVNARERHARADGADVGGRQQAPRGDAPVGRATAPMSRAIGEPDAGLQHGRQPVGGQRIDGHPLEEVTHRWQHAAAVRRAVG